MQPLGKAFQAAVAIVTVIAAAQTQAHHSYAAFDRCTAIALEGEIASVEWVNPHIRIRLRTQEVASYFVEWFSLAQLEHAGIATETLKPGDRVVVTGNPMRDPSSKVLSLLTEIRRPTDGWSWIGAARERPASCATN